MLAPVRNAFESLAGNKLRSVLTMLGTIVGVGCVVALWNIGESGRRYMSDTIAKFGKNLLVIQPKYNSEGEDSTRFHFKPLQLRDVDALRVQCPSLDGIAAVRVVGATVVARNHRKWTRVWACFPDYPEVGNWQIESGTMFNDADVRSASHGVLLGQTVAREVFGAIDPIGQRLRINDASFVVRGVLKEKGSLGMQNEDDRILMPFTTAATLDGDRSVNVVLANVRTPELIAQAKQEILMSVRASQQTPPDRKDTVWFQDAKEIEAMVDGVLVGITMLLGAIGAISLLVGGIGIMNIMLVSVTERTREIGLRLAVGATDFHVLAQFLIESMVLSGVGGIFGLGGGAGAAGITVLVLRSVTGRNWEFIVNPTSLVFAFTFALITGMVFGFYPAWRASRLDPIVALRHA